jgi:hypothetical protein
MFTSIYSSFELDLALKISIFDGLPPIINFNLFKILPDNIKNFQLKQELRLTYSYTIIIKP